MFDWLPDTIDATNRLIQTVKKNIASFVLVWLATGATIFAYVFYSDARDRLDNLEFRENMLVVQGQLSAAIAASHLRSQAIWPPADTKSNRTALIYAHDVAGETLATLLREQVELGAPTRTLTWSQRPVDASYRQLLDKLRQSNILILTTTTTQPTNGHASFPIPLNSDLGRLYRNEGVVTAVVVVSSQSVGETIYVSKSFVGELTEEELSLVLQITQDTALNVRQFVRPAGGQ